MFVRIFRKLWMHLLISFYDDYTIEGFEKTNAEINLPENLRELDPQVKREFTICNLFANQNLSIRDICVVLDASKHQVIDVLIENNLIKERRQKPAPQPAIRQLAEERPALSFIQLIDWVKPIFSRWIEEMGKMFVRIFRKFWMHMLISFNDDYTIEGFEKTKTKFSLPENLRELDPQIKRKFTICNLFANQNLSIRDICVVLDASKHQVIDVLIENNLIKERRQKPAPQLAIRQLAEGRPALSFIQLVDWVKPIFCSWIEEIGKVFVGIFRKFWMHLLISFNDDYTIEGFEKTKTRFDLPENLRELDPQIKRKFTICNLFANQDLSIRDICVVLDASKHQVIDVLIENNLIKERRRKNWARGKGSSSIPTDETTSESTNPNSSQEPKDSGRTGTEAESNFHHETSQVSDSASNESKLKADSGQGRRIA